MASCAFYCVKKERRRNRKEEEAERSVRCGLDVSWMHERSSLVEQEPLVLIGIGYNQLWMNKDRMRHISAPCNRLRDVLLLEPSFLSVAHVNDLNRRRIRPHANETDSSSLLPRSLWILPLSRRGVGSCHNGYVTTSDIGFPFRLRGLFCWTNNWLDVALTRNSSNDVCTIRRVLVRIRFLRLRSTQRTRRQLLHLHHFNLGASW